MQTTSFPKESVENADLYKPVLNKVITTHEKCMKYNFKAPFSKIFTIRCRPYRYIYFSSIYIVKF